MSAAAMLKNDKLTSRVRDGSATHDLSVIVAVSLSFLLVALCCASLIDPAGLGSPTRTASCARLSRDPATARPLYPGRRPTDRLIRFCQNRSELQRLESDGDFAEATPN